MDSKSGSRRHIHPCVCGFETVTYSKMKKHREACVQWQNRPNPLRLMIERHRSARVERAEGVGHVEPCSFCHHRLDHHDPSCPNSQPEKTRRELVEKHEIDPVDWQTFLYLLGLRYR